MSQLANILLSFDSLPLTDTVSSGILSITGNTPQIVDGAISNAWQMDDETYASLSGSMSVTNKFTIGFYLKPANPGLITTPLTYATTPLLMPVCSKSNFSLSGGVETPTSQQFIIYEETQADGTNKMFVSLKGATTAITNSNSYTSGQWHYFWIVYDGTIPSCTIYVDLQNETQTTSGTVPSVLSVSAAPFAVNYLVGGNTYEIARNTGTLDDLVGFLSVQDSTAMARSALYGGAYASDSSLIHTEEIDYGFAFDDSTTIQINAIASNRGNIYMARSDGQLLRGIKTLWQSRHTFSSQAELDLLDFVTTRGIGQLPLDEGSLHIQSETVQL